MPLKGCPFPSMSTFEAIVEKIKPALLPTYLVTRQLYTKAAGSDVNTELSFYFRKTC